MNAEELRKYANIKGLNLGQSEKDYYQNIILFVLYNKIAKELAFKGGTALAKCYGLNRFSEDLDFTVIDSRDFIGHVRNGLEEFGIKYSIKEIQKNNESEKYKIKIEGPLYNGTERTLCSITLDLSLRENVLVQPSIVTIGYNMDVIPVFETYVMAKKEIMAEKIRALMTRSSARDLYDLVFLIRSGTTADKKLITDKLAFYNMEFDEKKLFARCVALKKIWNSELKSLVRNVPDFNEYVGVVKSGSWLTT